MKRALIFVGVGLALSLVLYELAFRYQTRNFAGVEFRDDEARIYYVYDLASGENWRYQLFSPRIYAPVGSVGINNSGSIYLVKGRLYKKEADGSFRDWTEVMRSYYEKKNEKGA